MVGEEEADSLCRLRHEVPKLGRVVFGEMRVALLDFLISRALKQAAPSPSLSTMAPSRAPSVQLLRSLRTFDLNGAPSQSTKAFSTSCKNKEEVAVQRESFYRNPNPETVFVPRLERKLVAAGTPPIGSRRRRMAIAQSQGIPFDQLPFQCFQEARKILIADRQEKLKQIDTMRGRIARLQESDGNVLHRGGEAYKQKRLDSMKKELEHLKILADSNDPNVKRRFEDGKGTSSDDLVVTLTDVNDR